MNTDDKYMIIKLHAKFNELPNYLEFQSLFSEYKITSLNHRLVPYYSQNQPFTNGISPDFGREGVAYGTWRGPVREYTTTRGTPAHCEQSGDPRCTGR